MKFLARLGEILFNALGKGLTGVEFAIRYPFWLIFGNAQPKPSYEPELNVDDLMQVYNKRKSEGLIPLNSDGIDTVVRYCKALPSARRTFHFLGLPDDVRDTLLDMDQNELDALSKARPNIIRKFINGEDHGVHGVPVVGSAVPTDVSPAIQLQERIRRRMKKDYDPREARQIL